MSFSTNNWERKVMMPGYKFYMNSIQAHIANENLKLLDSKKERLSEIRNIYNKELDYTNTSDHLYRIKNNNRNLFINKMKATELKKLIREEVKKVLKETSNEDLLSMLRDYISSDYTVDQGWGDDVEEAEEDMKRIKAEIIKLKGKNYFDALDFFASQNTYLSEYAGPEDSEEIQVNLEKYAQKLGFTVDQLT